MSTLVDRITEVLRAWPYPPISEGNARKLAERVADDLQPEQNRQLIEAWQAGFNEGTKTR